MSDGRVGAATERILPTLIYIQTHLDADLSLARVAAQTGLSQYHFHRLFREASGETLKQYVQRLRLERAAFELKIRDAAIVDVALGAGYRSHETFSRAFKRHFGMAPSTFRLAADPRPRPGEDGAVDPGQAVETLNQLTGTYQISAVRVQKLAAIPLAFVRHWGDYTSVDMTLFDELRVWARLQGHANAGALLLGIGHDDPGITPLEKVRYDACIQVLGSFRAEGRVGFQWSPAGWFATATYVGPYGALMSKAYEAIFARVAQLREWRMVGLPAVEIYRATRILPSYQLNETDIYLPVEHAVLS